MWPFRRKAERQTRTAAPSNRPGAAPLREFVYLDETSVYSLVASRLGAIATEITDSASTSSEAQVGGTVGAGAAVLKSELTSQLRESRGRESQTLRKSVVQTTFRDLYELEADRLALRPVDPTRDDLERVPLSAGVPSLSSPWVVPASTLRRGAMIEVEVALGPEPIYQASSAFSTMFEIMRENPGFVASSHLEGLAEMEWVGQFFEKMLDGLVPLRGEIVDYSLVSIDADEYIVHKSVLRRLPPDAFHERPLYLVGVAAEPLFWKDIRRVLFGGDRYRALCRLGRTGVQDTWHPVKLAEVFRAVVPEVAKGFDELNRLALDLRSNDPGVATAPVHSGVDPRVQDMLLAYVTDVGETHGKQIDPRDGWLDSLSRVANGLDWEAFTRLDVKGRRALYQRVNHVLEERLSVTIEPIEAARFRATATVDTLGASLVHAVGEPPAPQVEGDDNPPAFIDAEVIAIYW